MSATSTMLESTPRGAPTGDLAALLDTLAECHTVCLLCADACLAEGDAAQMVDCIRLDLDCATVCGATSSVLTRRSNDATVRRLVEACRAACAACAEECERHGEHMEHCAQCAEVCRRCEAACASFLEALA